MKKEDRPGDPDLVHCCMPSMGYACGETIISVAGHFTLGAYEWGKVTCPGCRVWGQDYLLAMSKFMQGRGPHPDEVVLPAPEHHLVDVGEQMDLFEVAS